MDGRDESTRTPARMWFALLRRVGRGLTGRRFSVRDAAFTVVSLHGRPQGPRWSLGRAQDVQVVLSDVITPELTARELLVECDTLAVGSTVTATGVTITATVAPESLGALGEQDGPTPDISVVNGELRSPWLPGVDVVIELEVTDECIRFVPVALVTPVGRWTQTWWMPAGSAPSPELPGGLRLAEIATTDDAVVLQAVIDEWCAPLRDGSRLREVLGALSKDRDDAPVADVPEQRPGGTSTGDGSGSRRAHRAA
ncbi:hypothetical protein LQ327_23450 [Actinomycetospora endophytica]|uniref:Sporulation-control protein n=1 Tax=Actinomycetospora endophytica TaxID=2291215 RepID=A0ABS8PDH6_9PSEU|nr:hypothetical protein [Actinomycetospora endophytica]MCD2196334.1 hypothetical protein [Actinomycetospora endophytica]